MAVITILENRFLESVGISVKAIRIDDSVVINILERIREKKKSGYFSKLKEYDASDEDPTAIKTWLHSLVKNNVEVLVIWLNFNIGVGIDYHLFVENYDELWYPSSDDIWIVSSELTPWVIELDHEEIFSFQSTIDV